MFRGGGRNEIPRNYTTKPIPVSKCVDVVPGFKAYSADKIGPYSALVSNEIFGKGKRDDVKTHQQQQCDYHEQNIYGNFSSYYTPASLEREINTRVEIKLRQYENNLKIRQQRLKDLMRMEEDEQIGEIVGIAQREEENFLRDAKIRTQQLRAKRESERLELVQEKKLQQYLEKCEEFRPILENRRLKETKEVQKMQIVEKEILKENVKRENYMWYELLLERIRAQAECEERNNLALRRRNLEDKNTWDIQCKERELEKQDKLRETREDAIELDKIKEELRKQEIAELDAKRRKRNECYRDITTQITEKKEALAQQSLVEKLSQTSFNKRQEEEMEKIQNLREKERIKNEMQLFHDYILRLDQERKDEERRLDELIEMELNAIQQKQDEARQKYQKAQRELQKAVVAGLDKQLEHKREEAEQQLRIKQADNEILKMAHDHNERMRAEYARQQVMATQQYREDLKQQIEYKNEQKEHEKQQIEKQLLQGKIQEEEYKHNLIQILNSDVKVSEVHPFRQILNRKIIPCPKNLYY